MKSAPTAPGPESEATPTPQAWAILDHIAVGIALLGRSGRIADVNQRMQQLAGRDADELGRVDWTELAHPDDGPQGQALLQQVLLGERAEARFEQRLLRPDGSFVWVRVIATALRDAAGRADALALVVEDVTAAKLDEDSLRQSELRFRRLIEKLPAGAYTCDPEGLITYFNDQAVEIWGRAPRLFHPDDRWCGSFKLYAADGTPITHAECWMAKVLRDGRDYLGEDIQIERPDGTRVHAVAHASPLRDEGGRLVGSLNILIDVNDRKQAEALLRGSEERFERFMQHLPGLAWIKDPDGRYLFVNDAAEQAFQKSRAELYGRRDEELFPPETSTQFRANDLKALESGAAVETIETLEHADGVVHQSLVSKFPIPGPQGAPALIGGIAIDITARVEAEHALRETEARFRDMADHAPVLIWINDIRGCEFVNREYLSFLGCGMDEVRGDGWRRFIHPDDAEAYTSEYLRCVEQCRPFEAQFRFRRADGEYRWLRSTGVPRTYPDGTLIGYIGCSTDITAIKRSEDALRQADRRKDEFLATLAHELRNPLAPIRSSLQLLRESAGAPELCAMMERQVDQMVRLVDDLLEVSRISRGRVELRRERVELADVLRAALETSAPAIAAGGHRLELELPSEPLALEADPLRLAQVFVNLIDNAAKYTPDGGHIRVSASRRGEQVRVSVRDDGIGIAPELLPRVFEPFTQLAHSLPRAGSGLGIGLALVEQLVRMHGGRVEVHSEGSGRGSEFAVTLTLARSAETGRGESRPPARAAAQAPVRRVLVVDDNRDAADSLAMLLRARGLEADVAYDGATALESARVRVPAAVLLDLGMPGMDGYEVARRMRAEAACRDAVLVALTGWGHADVQSDCREAGFDHHLVKPVRLDALEALLELPARAPTLRS